MADLQNKMQRKGSQFPQMNGVDGYSLREDLDERSERRSVAALHSLVLHQQQWRRALRRREVYMEVEGDHQCLVRRLR